MIINALCENDRFNGDSGMEKERHQRKPKEPDRPRTAKRIKVSREQRPVEERPAPKQRKQKKS
jgi:hypothetical protein